MTNSQTLLSAVVAVSALHILISFILFLGSMSNLGQGKLEDKERKSFTLTSGIFWLISLLACITILVLVVLVKPKNEKTPCPIQLSQPGDSDRADIEEFINVMQEEFPDQIPNFDSSRTYLVVTGFYKQHLSPDHPVLPTPSSQPQISENKIQNETMNLKDKEKVINDLTDIIKNIEHVPIGYIQDNVIYGLGGQTMFNVK
jgi:hypothetical protein